VTGKLIGGHAPLSGSPVASAAARRLLERRSPHRGVRVTQQGHRRRRSGIARHALRLSGVQKIALAAVVELSLYSAAARASGGSRFDGTALRSAAAATAACTCANAFSTAAS